MCDVRVRARFVRGSKDRYPWHTTGLPNLTGPGLLAHTYIHTGRIRNNRSRCKQVSVCVLVQLADADVSFIPHDRSCYLVLPLTLPVKYTRPYLPCILLLLFSFVLPFCSFVARTLARQIQNPVFRSSVMGEETFVEQLLTVRDEVRGV